MTNPGNAVGTNGAYGGRTSVNAFNDVLAGFAGRGILSGWQCVPKTGLTVALGGNGTARDVAIAEDDTGNKTTINNISEQPVDITLAAAPTIGQRIDVIVAYVDNPPEGSTTAIDNPAACGMIPVAGDVVTNNPVVPTEAQIRTAIGTDGGSSTTAYYVVLATIAVTEGMTDVVAGNITPGQSISLAAADAMLDPNSTNPVQNKVVTGAITDLQDDIGDINTALVKLNTGTGVTLNEPGQ